MVELSENRNEQLTKEEAAVYDRQIRLWGVEAQQRYYYFPKILKLIFTLIQELYFCMF